MECRVETLAKNLLRFLVDVSTDSLDPELTEELLNRATRCLLLLDHCSRGKLMVRFSFLLFVTVALRFCDMEVIFMCSCRRV